MYPVVEVKRQVWECAVSWNWVLSFVKENENALTDLSTQDVVTKIVIPATRDKKSRYVDLLPESHVSFPTIFASHVWSAPFLDLVASLKEYLATVNEDQEQIFVWIDIFAVNQHRDSGTQVSDLQGLHVALQKSKETVVCIDRNAVLLTRIWCLFEIWHTFQLDLQRLKVIARDTNKEKLRSIFIKCDVAKAEATVIADRDRILEEIRQTIPFQQMNDNIKSALIDSARNDVDRIKLIKGDESAEFAFALDKYAHMISFIGKYAEAEPLLRQELAIKEKIYGSEHHDTGASLNNLAMLLKKMGNFKEAELLYQQSLSIMEKVHGPEHANTATTLSNYAMVLMDQGKPQEAELLCRRSLAIKEKVHGLDHPETSSTINNLSILLMQMKKYDEAEILAQRVLAIDEKVNGLEHPDTAVSLDNLATILRSMKKYGEAEPLYRKSLAIKEKVHGLEHPSTATSLNNLASLLVMQGKFVETEKIYRQTIAIQEKVYKTDHPSIATSLSNLAAVLMKLGKFKESEAAIQRAFDINQKTFGPNHPDTLISLKNLTMLKNKMKS